MQVLCYLFYRVGENWIHEKPELNTEIRVVITQERRVRHTVEAALTWNKSAESFLSAETTDLNCWEGVFLVTFEIIIA